MEVYRYNSGFKIMAKFKEKIEARCLRHQGYSLKEICEKLDIAKSTASLWCRDIKLTTKQLKRLEEKQIKCSLSGRLKGAKKQQQQRLDRIEQLSRQGKKDIGKLSKRDLFIAGIAFYWGEGCKTGCRAGFSNSDPDAIKFMMRWFREILNIENERFSLQVGINQIHRRRDNEVKKYWSKIINIPVNQFVKTSFKKVRNKKVYENADRHYGTLRISVNKSSGIQYRIWGWMNALHNQ